jgi:7-keto-8-aminopelargonate synthetase-like enzyme
MDLIDLEHKIMEAEDAGARVKLIATDGVFSMDGDVSDAIREAGNAYMYMCGRVGGC